VDLERIEQSVVFEIEEDGDIWQGVKVVDVIPTDPEVAHPIVPARVASGTKQPRFMPFIMRSPNQSSPRVYPGRRFSMQHVRFTG